MDNKITITSKDKNYFIKICQNKITIIKYGSSERILLKKIINGKNVIIKPTDLTKDKFLNKLVKIGQELVWTKNFKENYWIKNSGKKQQNKNKINKLIDKSIMKELLN